MTLARTFISPIPKVRLIRIKLCKSTLIKYKTCIRSLKGGGFNRTYSQALRQPKFYLLWQLRQLECLYSGCSCRVQKYKCQNLYSGIYTLAVILWHLYSGTLQLQLKPENKLWHLYSYSYSTLQLKLFSRRISFRSMNCKHLYSVMYTLVPYRTISFRLENRYD